MAGKLLVRLGQFFYYYIDNNDEIIIPKKKNIKVGKVLHKHK